MGVCKLFVASTEQRASPSVRKQSYAPVNDGQFARLHPKPLHYALAIQGRSRTRIIRSDASNTIFARNDFKFLFKRGFKVTQNNDDLNMSFTWKPGYSFNTPIINRTIITNVSLIITVGKVTRSLWVRLSNKKCFVRNYLICNDNSVKAMIFLQNLYNLQQFLSRTRTFYKIVKEFFLIPVL